MAFDLPSRWVAVAQTMASHVAPVDGGELNATDTDATTEYPAFPVQGSLERQEEAQIQ